MKSGIYFGRVYHSRKAVTPYSFFNRYFLFSFELSELSSLNRFWPLLGYNHPAIFSIRDSSYLQKFEGRLPDKYLAAGGSSPESREKCFLLTAPRLFGYVFNPVSFFIPRKLSGEIPAMLVQVNNTFGESHLYRLENRSEVPGKFLSTFDKAFFVSPFFDVSGQYSLELGAFDSRFDLRIPLKKDGQQVFSAGMRAHFKELSLASILRAMFLYPFQQWLTLSKIHWHAVILRFIRKAGFYPKPEPRTEGLLRSCPGFVHRLRMTALPGEQKGQ